jgi:neurofibromin 1
MPSRSLTFVYFYRHTLLDAKITNVLSLCHDQVILSAVQSIIQNMITLEDPSQQQPHYLQSVGFGGLWRFAGPFTKVGYSSFQRLA